MPVAIQHAASELARGERAPASEIGERLSHIVQLVLGASSHGANGNGANGKAANGRAGRQLGFDSFPAMPRHYVDAFCGALLAEVQRSRIFVDGHELA